MTDETRNMNSDYNIDSIKEFVFLGVTKIYFKNLSFKHNTEKLITTMTETDVKITWGNVAGEQMKKISL